MKYIHSDYKTIHIVHFYEPGEKKKSGSVPKSGSSQKFFFFLSQKMSTVPTSQQTSQENRISQTLYSARST